MKATALASLATALVTAANPEGSRAATAPSGRPCPIDAAQVPRSPVKVEGTVVGVTSPERARASTAWVEKQTGASISPDYADLPRVIVRVVRGAAVSETMAAVVDGRIPRPGDRVEILSRYRDPRTRCNFIPWTVGSAPAVS